MKHRTFAASAVLLAGALALGSLLSPISAPCAAIGAADAFAAETAPRLLVTNHRSESGDRLVRDESGDSFPLAWVAWSEVALQPESAAVYPALAATLQADALETEQKANAALAEAWKFAAEAGTDLFTSNNEEWHTLVVRADSRAVNLLTEKWQFFGGPHPFTWWESSMYDTQTGERVPLADVINGIDNMKALPRLILDHLEAIDGTSPFTAADRRSMLPVIEAAVADGGLVWTIDSYGFHVYFDAYALMYYAFGPITADLNFREYPELIVPQYRPVEADAAADLSSLSARVTEVDAETITVPVEELDALLAQDLSGDWTDRVSSRAHLSAVSTGEPGQYDMTVLWGSGASSSRVWNFTAQYDSGTGLLSYTDGQCMDMVTDAAGNQQMTILYQNAAGSASLTRDGVLVWNEGIGLAPSVCEFVRD